MQGVHSTAIRVNDAIEVPTWTCSRQRSTCTSPSLQVV